MTLEYLARRFDGMDGSHYQPDAGPVDMLALHAASAGDWIAWKATQSNFYVDPTFARKRQEAKAVGFRSRFFYHWISSTRDVPQQVAHFLRLPAVRGPRAEAEFADLIDRRRLAPKLEELRIVHRRLVGAHACLAHPRHGSIQLAGTSAGCLQRPGSATGPRAMAGEVAPHCGE